MSVNGSLEHYDKHNESFLNITDVSSHQCSNLNATISTVAGNSSTIMTAKSNQNIIINKAQTTTPSGKRIHFNRLWSVWYGILVTLLQGYLIVQGLHKYLGKLFFSINLFFLVENF
jgi:hypothetical protein